MKQTNNEDPDELIAYANGTPELISLLYDLDFMPEQVKEYSRGWLKMLAIIVSWKNRTQPLET